MGARKIYGSDAHSPLLFQGGEKKLSGDPPFKLNNTVLGQDASKRALDVCLQRLVNVTGRFEIRLLLC